MTFEEYYKKVTEKSGVFATVKYVRILWERAYTIDQAVHALKTMDD